MAEDSAAFTGEGSPRRLRKHSGVFKGLGQFKPLMVRWKRQEAEIATLEGEKELKVQWAFFGFRIKKSRICLLGMTLWSEVGSLILEQVILVQGREGSFSEENKCVHTVSLYPEAVCLLHPMNTELVAHFYVTAGKQ